MSLPLSVGSSSHTQEMIACTNDEPSGRLPLVEVLAEVAESFRAAKASGVAHPDGHIIG